MRVGLISDTHGLLRPEAVAALRGCERIVHAGDVGKPAVLAGLEALAPVTAVRGNVDRGAWADALPPTAMVAAGATVLYVIHDRAELDPEELLRAGARAVISGHSHQPGIEERGGVLYLNPGAAGPRRFRRPISLAVLEVGESGVLRAELITLSPG